MSTMVESSETYGKLKGPVQKLISMICFHLHKVLGGQIWTETAKIEQNCSIFPSLLKGLKCHHRWELRNLWHIKGSCPKTVLNDLYLFYIRYKDFKFGLKQRKLSKIAPFSRACLRGQNVTIVESSETYGILKGPVQKLFSMICFHLHKV